MSVEVCLPASRLFLLHLFPCSSKPRDREQQGGSVDKGRTGRALGLTRNEANDQEAEEELADADQGGEMPEEASVEEEVSNPDKGK